MGHMNLSARFVTSLFLLGAASAVACSTAADDTTGRDIGETIEKSAKIVDSIAPTATIEGTFDPRVRTYGYVVPVKAGAKITARLEAQGGSDANRPDKAAPLDTVIQVSAPFKSPSERGAKITESDDGESAGAPPVVFKADKDQNFFIAFSSWEDTGTGRYKLSLTCEGTDFQCQRAQFDKPCETGDGPLYVQGAAIEGNVTWDKCEVVLLEQATVTPGSTLTIRPGVTVKGNYLSNQNPNDRFGTVRLDVQGLLQVVGTAQHPVAFTSLKGDRGWGGITLRSPGNSMQHVVIERGNQAVEVMGGASLNVDDSLIEGVTIDGQRSGAGIVARQDVDATFKRAVVKGFARGLDLVNAHRMVVEDSVIRENGLGMFIQGTGGQTADCGSPPQVTTWRDPIVTHTDIINNEQQGILVSGSDVLVQVAKSNIVGNGGVGIEIQGRGLNPASFFRESNVYGNSMQSDRIDFRTYHRGGTIDISQNYWQDISDPELSANWQRPCGNNSAITFTGFSPKAIADAGPHKDKLAERVRKHCYEAAN